MDLDEAVEVERIRLGVELLQLLRRERRDHQQRCIGLRRGRLVQLVAVEREVLAQDRKVGRRARGAQVGERAAEMLALGQDRERRGTAALVSRDQFLHRVRAPRQVAGGGRAPLVLGDQRDPRRGQRLVEGPALDARRDRSLELLERDLLTAALDLLANRAGEVV